MALPNGLDTPRSPRTGVFVGHVGVDLIYLSPQALGPNQKLAALDWTISAGGPALKG